MGEVFIETLLNEWHLSDDKKLPMFNIRQMIISRLDFLVNFVTLEAFFMEIKHKQGYCDLYGSMGEGEILLQDFVFDTFENLYEEFIKTKDINLIPNIFRLETELKKVLKEKREEETKKNTGKKTNKRIDSYQSQIYNLREAFIAYSASKKCHEAIHPYMHRVTKILHRCLIDYIAECSFVESVKRRKGEGQAAYITQPCAGFSDYILNQIKDARLKASMQHKWPSLLPLNNWGGKFPEFDNGGFLTNEKDKHSTLIHVRRHKAHVTLCQLSKNTLSVINSLQAMPHSLNPLLVDYFFMNHPFRLLFLKDFDYESSNKSKIY